MSTALYFESGRRTEAKLLWKVWAHDGEPPAGGRQQWMGWEMRRLLEHVGERFDGGVGRWTRHYQDKVEAWMSIGGLELAEHFVPSFKSLRAKGEAAPNFAKEEFQLTSEGVIAVLMGLGRSRRMSTSKDMAVWVLSNLIGTVCPEDDDSVLRGLDIHFVSAHDRALCDIAAGDLDDDCCVHLRGFLAKASGDEAYLKVFMQLLDMLWQGAVLCPTMAAMLSTVLPKLAAVLEAHIGDSGAEDPMLFEKELMMETTSAKRRRIDQDLKTAMMHDAMKNNRARTPGALGRAVIGLTDKTVVSWLPEHMGRYAAALKECFSDIHDVAICYDASRAGCPKNDVLAFAVCNVQTNMAGWLAPQVDSGNAP